MDANALLENAPLIFAISIVGVLGFLLLLAVGLNMLRAEAKPKAAPGETPDEPPARRGFRLPPFLASLAGRLPRVSLPSAGAAPADAHEVQRVLRHHLTGRVVVEVGGRRYRQLDEIDDAVRQGLHVTLRDLGEFLAGLPPEPGPAAQMPSPQPPPAAAVSMPALEADEVRPAPAAPPPIQTPSPQPSTPAAAEVRPAPAAPPASEPRPASETAPIAAALNPLPPKPAAQAGTPPPLRVPSMNPFKQVMVLRELGASEPPPPKSIADQIDEVLQHLIAGTPFAARSLAVRSGPRGNVIFESDGQAYNAIDDLPDATVQAVFREAIKQWENR